MIRRISDALVFVLAFLILVAEVQRIEDNEVTEFRSTTQRGQ